MSALIRAVLSATSLELQPGEKADVTLTIQNFGEIVDRYTISVEGPDPSWFSLSRAELSLFPKDQDQVRLLVQLPAAPAARAGHYEVRVQVVSQENPAERTALALDLVVAAQSALEVSLHPQQQSGLTEGTFTVQVNNGGNRDLTVQLLGSDPEEACLYAFNPPQFAVPAGQGRAAQLLLRPKVALPRETAKTYPFTVTARPLEDAKLARQVQGQWQKIGIPKRKVWPIVLGVLAALLAVVVVLLILFVPRACGGPVPPPEATQTLGPAVGPGDTSLPSAPTATPLPSAPTATPLPSQPTATPVPTVPTPTPTIGISPIGGAWIGTLVEVTGDKRTLSSVILIEHEAGSSTFGGHVYNFYQSAELSDYAILDGTFDGVEFRFREESGRHFWGRIRGEKLVGQVAWNCYDCAHWGTLDFGGPWTGPLSGAWAGQLTEKSGRVFSALLLISQKENSETFSGQISFSQRGAKEEVYSLLDGEYDGKNVRFREPGGRYFWGTVALGKFDGEVAWNCYDCSSWGTLYLEHAGFSLRIVKPFPALPPVRPIVPLTPTP